MDVQIIIDTRVPCIFTPLENSIREGQNTLYFFRIIGLLFTSVGKEYTTEASTKAKNIQGITEASVGKELVRVETTNTWE